MITWAAGSASTVDYSRAASGPSWSQWSQCCSFPSGRDSGRCADTRATFRFLMRGTYSKRARRVGDGVTHSLSLTNKSVPSSTYLIVCHLQTRALLHPVNGALVRMHHPVRWLRPGGVQRVRRRLLVRRGRRNLRLVRVESAPAVRSVYVVTAVVEAEGERTRTRARDNIFHKRGGGATSGILRVTRVRNN